MFDPESENAGQRRPKLIFFRSVRDQMPAFLTAHIAEQSRCLRQFFDVVELPPDCDYDEVCDRQQPDLVMFESGVDSGNRRIRNISAHPHVPKLGFLHCDAFDVARARFISEMSEWGIETFFTHSVAMGEYTPEIADRLYVWPNFIDPTVFRDYGLEKVVPVLFTGSQIPIYPWRNAVSRVLSLHYPTMICPHLGWHARAGSRQMQFGEKYARLLNVATFVPACGSMTRDLVRKHLEIPAVGACLVTERTATLESIGFRDMENCVFATPNDVVEKLDALLADEERLDHIIRAGHDLVHGRHTMALRSQIREWFDLQHQLNPGESIIQDNPSGHLRIVAATVTQANRHIISGGVDRALLRKGWELIGADRFSSAESLFRRCLNHAFVPEATIGLTHCQLLRGDWRGAKNSVERWLDITFGHHKCRDPDPVAWATAIRVALCCGKFDEARNRALQFSHLRHQELDRIRAALGVDAGSAGLERPRPSIAPPPSRNEHEWRSQLILMLRACGQDTAASAIDAGLLRPEADKKYRQGKAATISKRLITESTLRARVILRGLRRTLTETDWTAHVQRVVSCEPALRAVILAPSPLSIGQRAFKRALRNSPWLPEIVEVPAGKAAASGLAVGSGDILYVTARAARLFELAPFLESAGLVFVDGINLSGGQELTQRLSARSDFALILHDGADKVGYAIYRRLMPQLDWPVGQLSEQVESVGVAGSYCHTGATHQGRR